MGRTRMHVSALYLLNEIEDRACSDRSMAGGPDSFMDAPSCVVSGANRGLGLELCRQLLHRGWPVVALCRRTSPELQALAASGASCDSSHDAGVASLAASAQAPRVLLTVVEGVDVAEDSCVPLIQRALAGTPVGLLILNAGILSVDSIAELDTSTIRQQFEVNALGPLRVAHALLPNLVSCKPAQAAGAAGAAGVAEPGAGPPEGSREPGPEGSTGGSSSSSSSSRAAAQAASSGTPAPAKVAVVTSKMGSIALTKQGGKNGSVGYRMSKAAANMGAQLLALDLAQRGIPLVAVHPGAVATDMHAQYWAAVTAGGTAGVGGMAPSAHGPISVQDAAAGVLERLDELSMGSTGRFVQAATGEELPW